MHKIEGFRGVWTSPLSSTKLLLMVVDSIEQEYGILYHNNLGEILLRLYTFDQGKNLERCRRIPIFLLALDIFSLCFENKSLGKN